MSDQGLPYRVALIVACLLVVIVEVVCSYLQLVFNVRYVKLLGCWYLIWVLGCHIW